MIYYYRNPSFHDQNKHILWSQTGKAACMFVVDAVPWQFNIHSCVQPVSCVPFYTADSREVKLHFPHGFATKVGIKFRFFSNQIYFP